MPNIITHTLFAQEIFDKVDENTHDLFEPRLHLLEIGSNGPDFLFFHGMNPKDFFKKSDLRVSGSMFHAGFLTPCGLELHRPFIKRMKKSKKI